MVTALITAAGQGRRMGAGRNKVLLQLGGESILARTLRRFSACRSIDDLIVTVSSGEIETAAELLNSLRGLKPWQITAGGAERQYSIANGLRLLHPRCSVVLVHDAARPLVALETIEKVAAAARRYGAAIAAVPEKNTIKIVDGDGIVISTPARSCLWSVQTPQGFQRDIIERAYRQAAADRFVGTDDAGLVERLGVPVRVVMGKYSNLKITTPEDMLLAASYLQYEENGDDND